VKIDRLILGAYQTNCYILRAGETAKDCLIIDTGLEAGELVDFLQRHELNPVAVVLTHGHADHITGVALLRENYTDIKVYIHKSDAKMLTEMDNNMLVFVRHPFRNSPADFLIEEPSVINEADIKLKVLHTPGHTPGGISLYSPRHLQKGRGSRDEGIVFVGDTLFADSVGRVDLGGNMTQLIKSIKEKLCTLPDETIVYPGHGPITTIAREKASNPYLQ
jgi:hydroxyacylglutathione hydrolase